MKRWLTYVPLVLCLCASCALTSNDAEDNVSRDWTIFRGSPSLNGYVEYSIPASPRLLWSKTLQSRTVAAPIVYDGWVYILDRKGRLHRFSPEGDTLLVHDFQTTIEASFVVDDSTLYVGRIDGRVNAFALNKQQVTWDFETLGQIAGSPNLVGDQLLVGSYDGGMYSIDKKTGKKTGLFQTSYYINGTAAVWGSYIMFGGCDAWVRVVDIETGVMTDSLELDSYVPASPAILNGVACTCDYNGNVYEMTLDNGKITSHRKLLAASTDRPTAGRAQGEDEGQAGGVVSMPALTRTDVYILSGERYISCISRTSGQVRWKKLLRGMTGECSPLVAQDKVLVCTKDGHVSLLNCKDGAELWHYEAGEQIVASPAIVGDRFYILTTKGTLLCFA